MLPFLPLAAAAFVGNQACVPCHAGIVRRYERTPMARSTGAVRDNIPTGRLKHSASGAEYAVTRRGAVEIRRAGRAVARERFDFTIGSGAAGFSYLLFRGGLLFQAPIAWYSQAKKWDAAPGHEADREMAWTKPVEPSCLMCHASQVTPVYGTLNKYVDPPFKQNGVACERCHGAGSEHIAGRARMAMPSRLDPERRDDVCRQCHLLGESRIPRPGRSFAEYRAGARLADHVAYFVYDDPAGPSLRTTSHVEKLLSSTCKKAAGERLWCGTCHDPHTTPVDAAAWYRAKCLACHAPDPCRRGGNCAACHMPKSRAVDAGGHGAFTDHAIARKPAPSREGGSPEVWRLRPFSPADSGDRELGLAYVEAFGRTRDERQKAEAIRLLRAR